KWFNLMDLDVLPTSPCCIARPVCGMPSLGFDSAPIIRAQVSAWSRAWLTESSAQAVSVRPAAAAMAAILPKDLIDTKVPFRDCRIKLLLRTVPERVPAFADCNHEGLGSGAT